MTADRHAPNFRHWRRALALACLFALLPAEAADIDAFLERHWQRPIPAQGQAPEGFSALEASLDPDDCGRCHPNQRSDWGDSLHSRAMGPGLMGQLIDMPADDRQLHQRCLRCHAPLAEQADALVAEISGDTAANGLHRRGLVCAACHVRQHRRFGPARKDGGLPGEEPLPHNGWEVSPAFSDSRFCASCHQFEEGDFALNGKLLENTYQEWLASPYPEQGVSCQSCHMAERRHLWKGIHDPQTVRRGVSISATLHPNSTPQLTATLRLTNTGTGHRFPTYVTPQVVLEGYQEDAAGHRIDGTESYFVVARRVALDLSEEIFDTRLAVGESAALNYDLPLATGASNLVMRVWVQPDFFYEQFYTSLLEYGQTQRGTDAIEKALAHASRSTYTLFEQRLPLTGS